MSRVVRASACAGAMLVAGCRGPECEGWHVRTYGGSPPYPIGPTAGVAGAAGAAEEPIPTDVGRVGGYGIDVSRGTHAIALDLAADEALAIDGDAVIVAGRPARPTGGLAPAMNVARVGASGALEWRLTFEVGTPGPPWLVTDSAGNLLVAGSFEGRLVIGEEVIESTVNPGEPEPFGPRGQPSRDVFVLKLDRAGRLLWGQRLGGVANQEVFGVNVAADGVLTLVVAFAGRLELGAETLTSSFGSSGSDLAFVRLDPGGAVVDAVHLTAYHSGHAAFDSRGNVVLYREDGLAKLDSQGNVLWTSSAGDDDPAYAVRVALDADDSVIVVGRGTHAGQSFYATPLGDSGFALAKLSAEGGLLFVRLFGESTLDWAPALAASSDGGILLAGSFHDGIDFGGGRLEAVPNSTYEGDVFVAELAPDGSHRFSVRAGGAGRDAGTGVGVLSDGRVVVNGWFASSIDFGSGTITRDFDSFLAWLTP